MLGPADGSGWQGSPERILKRAAVLFALVTALLVLSSFPLHAGGFGEVRPAFMLIAVYYWSTLKPDVLSPLSAFIIGIVLDLLAGYPLGVQALVFVLAQWTTRGQRKFLMGQPFAVMWAGFALVAGVAAVLQWALFSLFYFETMDVRAVLASALLTCLVFPVVVWGLSAFNKTLAARPASVA